MSDVALPAPAVPMDRAAPAAPRAAVHHAPKAFLPALTAVRAFSAIEIMLFHFGDPHDFGWFAPIVDGGYVAVSFFFLLSGFILAYNYADRADHGTFELKSFWLNRIARLYPVFLLGLLISYQMLQAEWTAHSRPMFWTGVVLTPLMMEAWQPVLATFWSTPAWAVSVEISLYLAFPLLLAVRLPKRLRNVFALWGLVFLCGLILPLLYIWLKPDGPGVPNRFSGGIWLRALKFMPPEHIFTFFCGIILARIHVAREWAQSTRMWVAVIGMAGAFSLLTLAYQTQTTLPLYPLMHEPLMVPFYSMIIFGLAAPHWLAKLIARPLFVKIGEASYCLYILHFNMWLLLHNSGVLVKLHLARYDPWISYLLLLIGALLAYNLVEEPARKYIRRKVVLAD
jgi:peptidoglycan/LPS O-acetylase OafA/YrhL